MIIYMIWDDMGHWHRLLSNIKLAALLAASPRVTRTVWTLSDCMRNCRIFNLNLLQLHSRTHCIFFGFWSCLYWHNCWNAMIHPIDMQNYTMCHVYAFLPSNTFKVDAENSTHGFLPLGSGKNISNLIGVDCSSVFWLILKWSYSK